jgi:hypothetical protein
VVALSLKQHRNATHHTQMYLDPSNPRNDWEVALRYHHVSVCTNTPLTFLSGLNSARAGQCEHATITICLGAPHDFPFPFPFPILQSKPSHPTSSDSSSNLSTFFCFVFINFSPPKKPHMTWVNRATHAPRDLWSLCPSSNIVTQLITRNRAWVVS